MIRDAETDYLQFVIAKFKPYAAMVPALVTALQRTGTRQVLDLCSGAGGPWQWLHPALAAKGLNVSVRLTDKYPNAGAVGQVSRLANQFIRYHAQPVDATRVPEELAEFRTMFSAFHHFRPEEARAVLADAVRKRQGIGVFEGTHNSLWGSDAAGTAHGAPDDSIHSSVPLVALALDIPDSSGPVGFAVRRSGFEFEDL